MIPFWRFQQHLGWQKSTNSHRKKAQYGLSKNTCHHCS